MDRDGVGRRPRAALQGAHRSDGPVPERGPQWRDGGQGVLPDGRPTHA